MRGSMKYLINILNEGNYEQLDSKTLKKVLPDFLRRILESDRLDEETKKRVLYLSGLTIEYIYNVTYTQREENI